MGGTNAAIATKDDLRILAGVNLDGPTFPGMNADVRPVELHKPLLSMLTEEHAADPSPASNLQEVRRLLLGRGGVVHVHDCARRGPVEAECLSASIQHCLREQGHGGAHPETYVATGI